MSELPGKGFTDLDYQGKEGFVYTDFDGDKLSVWRWEGGTPHIRFEAADASSGVDIDSSDYPEFFRRIEELKKLPCPNCKGTGKV